MAKKVIDGVADCLEKAENVELELSDVYCDITNNVRNIDSEAYSEESIRSLADQIKATGGLLQQMGVVSIRPSEKNGNCAYCIFWGHRRYKALELLAEEEGNETWGTQTFRRIGSGGSISGFKTIQVIENIARQNLSPLEVAKSLSDVLEEGGDKGIVTQADLASITGFSDGYISQYLGILKLPQVIRDMIAGEQLSFTHARQLIGMDEDIAANLAKLGKSMTAADFKAKVDIYKPKEGDGDSDNDDTSTKKVSTQKTVALVSSKKVTKHIIPFLKQRIENADEEEKVFSAADIAKARLDTVRSMMKDAETKLNKDLQPFIKKIEEEENEKKKVEEAGKKKEDFTKSTVREINRLINLPVDDETDERPYPSVTSALAKVTKDLKALSEEARNEKYGFQVDINDDEDYEKFAKSTHDSWLKDKKEKKEKKRKAAKAKAKKDAEKKAEEAAKAKKKKADEEAALSELDDAPADMPFSSDTDENASDIDGAGELDDLE